MSKSRTYTTTVTIYGAWNEDGDRTERVTTIRTAGTMTALTAGVLRALRVPKSARGDVKVSLHLGQVRATLRAPNGRLMREAATAPIPSLRNAPIQSCALPLFLAQFTTRDVFTSTRDQFLYIYASRTAQQKREDDLIAAFNRLPAKYQTQLLKALDIGPAIVLSAADAGSR